MEPGWEARSSDTVAAFERVGAALSAARRNLRGAVFGQDSALSLALSTLVADGHALICGAPGLAKTKLAAALSQVAGLPLGGLQFHPDTPVTALVGETRVEDRVLGPRTTFHPGPIFRPLLLADELDRGSGALQSALFEAMDDSVAVAGGERRPLPRPFTVLATTTAAAVLSPSQTDRFLVRIDMAYPERDDERRLLLEVGRDAAPTQALDRETVLEAQRLAVELPVGQSVVESILNLVRRARPEDEGATRLITEYVERGPGPRAGQALMRLARAQALVEGRPAPSIADVKALAPPVLRHRIELTPEARRDGVTADAIVAALAETL